MPGDTLVVLSRDPEGNLFSPFSTYSLSRYAPTHSELVGDVFPLPEELEEEESLRELYADGPRHRRPRSGALPARLSNRERGGAPAAGRPAPLTPTPR